jgi:hypothetical protein
MKKSLCLVAAALWAGGIAKAQDYPRAETFFGYDLTRANSASNVPSFHANGGSLEFAIDANRHFGFVADLGVVQNGNINGAHLDSTFTNFLFGPRISLRHSRVTPYFDVLFGGVYASTSAGVTGTLAYPPTPTNPIYLPGDGNVTGAGPVSLRAVASQTAFAMVAGGGLDIKLSRHVNFRPIGLDYYMTRVQNFRTAHDNNQHNIRYTMGFNFTFGGEAPSALPPPPPPTHACWDGTNLPVGQDCPMRTMDLRLTTPQTQLCPGATGTLAAPVQLPGNATYLWTIEGRTIGKDANLVFGTTGREPGTYKVNLKVSAPGYNDATAELNLAILEYRAPSGTLEANPFEIFVGQKATLTAHFSPGQCGGNISAPVFTASEGSVSGTEFDSTDVQFDPAIHSEQRKSITVVAKVTDDKGSANAQATIVVKKPATSQARRLPDIIFPTNNARVNNCGKRVLLEELKPMIESDPNGKVVLVGHMTEGESGKSGLDQQRALNAAAVISAGQGICYAFPASRILVGGAGATNNGVDFQSRFCAGTQETPGSTVKETESDAKFRRVEVWFVPTGGVLPASLSDYKGAESLSVSTLGCPR